MREEHQNQPFRFRGFSVPNYTQVPDELFDELLPLLGGAELKVLLYVIRRTFGFKKGSDRISKSQLENGITRKNGEQLDNGTGLSRRSIRLAVDGLVDKNILLKHRHASTQNGDEATEYALNISGRDPWVKSTPGGGGGESTHGEGKKVPPQETVKQQTVKVVNGLPTNDQKSFSRRGNTQPAISDRALRAKYRFTDEQLAQVHYLVEKQATLLGAVDRNHAHYVKRAAEAVAAGDGQQLDAKLGDFKQASTALTVGLAPAYFHTMWKEDCERRRGEKAMRAATRKATPPPSTSQSDDRIARMIADAEGRGVTIPDFIRKSTNYQQVSRWWASLVDQKR